MTEFEGKAVVPESEVGREYYLQQQIVALNNGDDAWMARDNPNERLLKMARTVMKDREQPRIKLPVSSAPPLDSVVEHHTKRSHG